VIIKYLACFDTERNRAQNRAYPLSAAAVMQPVISALREKGHEVEIISFSSTKGESSVPGCCYTPEAGVTVRLFRSFGRKWMSGRAANRVFMKLQYYAYLLKNIRAGDVVIAYHSPYYVMFLRWLRKHRNFHLVLQMLEIYADVTEDETLRKREKKLTECADAFLFSSQLLAEKINVRKKPALLLLGNYHVEEERKLSSGDGKIHVLYAGTLDPRKGAACAVKAAAFLPQNYHVHILGVGSERERAELKRLIEETRAPGHGAVSYDGVLSGEDYLCFLQKCQIGLCTQSMDAGFNETSFPSKILSYLCNGLRVVSVRIKAVETSPVGDLMVYYDTPTAEAAAEAVLSVDLTQRFCGRERVRALYEQFSKELDRVLWKQI